MRQLLFSVLEEYGLMASHEGVDADLGDILGNYIARGGLFLVVFASEAEMADGRPFVERQYAGHDRPGQLVGMVGLYPRGDGIAELRKMYLRKAARGRGLGKLLLNRVLARARELGFRRIELETSSKLVEAIALYKSHGFMPLGLDQIPCRCDQAFYLDLQ